MTEVLVGRGPGGLLGFQEAEVLVGTSQAGRTARKRQGGRKHGVWGVFQEQLTEQLAGNSRSKAEG